MRQTRRTFLYTSAGLTFAALTGCGGGGSGGTRALTVNDYVRLDLGWLGVAPHGIGRQMVAINNSGEVAMNLQVPATNGEGGVRAFRWSRGALQEIHPADGATYSFVAGINDSGQVVLWSWDGILPLDGSGLRTRVYRFANGSYEEIPPPPGEVSGVVPIALAQDGTVTGTYALLENGEYQDRSFLWRGGAFTLIEGLAVTGVNARGQLLLRLEGANQSDPDTFGLREANGQVTNLREADPNTEYLEPFALTDDGTVVGDYHPPDGIGKRLGRFRNGRVESLHDGLEQIRGYDINDAGDIVAEDFDGPYLARQGGPVLNFRSLFPPQPTPGTHVPRAVNNRGQIAGIYSDTRIHRERFTLFLLTPRTLAPPNGTAAVTLGDRSDPRLDESPFETVSVTGNLISDRYLSARIAAYDSASGARELLCTLRLPSPIETGKPYPVSAAAHAETGAGVTFLDQKIPPVIQGPHDPFSVREGVFPAQSGTLTVDRITAQEITFRLQDIRFGMRLDATVTLKR